MEKNWQMFLLGGIRLQVGLIKAKENYFHSTLNWKSNYNVQKIAILFILINFETISSNPCQGKQAKTFATTFSHKCQICDPSRSPTSQTPVFSQLNAFHMNSKKCLRAGNRAKAMGPDNIPSVAQVTMFQNKLRLQPE